jgi:hypothetical protein
VCLITSYSLVSQHTSILINPTYANPHCLSKKLISKERISIHLYVYQTSASISTCPRNMELPIEHVFSTTNVLPKQIPSVVYIAFGFHFMHTNSINASSTTTRNTRPTSNGWPEQEKEPQTRNARRS